MLQFTEETREKDILSLTGTGRVREFQLRYRVGFRVHDGKGGDFVPPSTIQLTRDITFNDAEILAKEAEEQLLFRDMQADMVQQILRRLAAAKPPAAARAVDAAQAEQLDGHLAKTLAPVYAIHGDEPLLALEAADAVRAAARKRGFDRARGVRAAGRGFDWSELAHAGASLSLFGEQEDRRAAPAERQARRAGRARRSSPSASGRARTRCCSSPCRARKAAAGGSRRGSARSTRPAWSSKCSRSRAARCPAGSPSASRARSRARRARCSSSSPTASRATCSPRTRRCRSSRCSRPKASSRSRRCATRSPTSRASTRRRRRGAARRRHRALRARARRPARRRRGADLPAVHAVERAVRAAAARRAAGSTRRCSARCAEARGAIRRAALDARASRTPPRIDRAIKGVGSGRAVGGVRQARARAARRGPRGLAIRMAVMQVKAYMRRAGPARPRGGARARARRHRGQEPRACRDGRARSARTRGRSSRRTRRT